MVAPAQPTLTRPPSNEIPPGAVNVLDYGVAGNGITDDAAAIQALINNNAGTVLWFPAATYKLGSYISLVDNSILQGVPRESIFSRTPSGGAAQNTVVAYDKSGFVVQGIKVKGNDPSVDNLDTWGFRFSGCSNGRLTGIYLEGLRDGIKTETPTNSNMMFEDITGYHNMMIGYLSNLSSSTLRRWDSWGYYDIATVDTGGHGIYAAQFNNDNTYEDLKLLNHYSYGFQLYPGEHNRNVFDRIELDGGDSVGMVIWGNPVEGGGTATVTDTIIRNLTIHESNGAIMFGGNVNTVLIDGFDIRNSDWMLNTYTNMIPSNVTLRNGHHGGTTWLASGDSITNFTVEGTAIMTATPYPVELPEPPRM